MRKKEDKTLSLSVIKEAYRNNLYKHHTGREECPAPEKLVPAARMELPLRERLAILDHIDKCGSCAREFHTTIAILKKEKEFLRQIADENPGVRERIRPWFFQNRPVLAAVSAVFLVMAATAFILILTRPEPVHMRSGEPSIQIISPVETVNASKIKFAWNETAGTEYYRLHIFGDDLRPLWESGRIYSTRWTPAPDVLSELKSGKTYFWMVTAYRESGSPRESGLIKFAVK